MNIIALVIMEAIIGCFIVLIACVIGIANGPEGLACFYESEVHERIVKLGITTTEKIKKNGNRFKLFGILPFFVLMIAAVYGINGARTFFDGFWQMCVILLTEGLFDRLFIDYYWVGKTKAWVITGTEDLRPYIYGKTLVSKWVGTVVGYPLIAAVISAIAAFFIK